MMRLDHIDALTRPSAKPNNNALLIVPSTFVDCHEGFGDDG
jgi:hypothetical protein